MYCRIMCCISLTSTESGTNRVTKMGTHQHVVIKTTCKSILPHVLWKEKTFLLYFTIFLLIIPIFFFFTLRHHLTGIQSSESEKILYCKKLCKYAWNSGEFGKDSDSHAEMEENMKEEFLQLLKSIQLLI